MFKFNFRELKLNFLVLYYSTMKFVIIREDYDSKLPFVINTIYDNPDTLEYIEKWINNYLNDEIKGLLYLPNRENERSISYEIEEIDGGEVFSLFKKYEKVEKGYFYNKYENVYKKLFDIKVIKDEESCNNLGQHLINLSDESAMKFINDEVNQRVLRSLEREALQVFLNDIRNAIKNKKAWNTDELLYLESQILKQLKKKLTNKIRKNVMKEFSESNSNENDQEENNKISKFKFEYTILDKYGKKD